MKLEFKSFKPGTIFIFTQHGIEIAPDSIPEPFPASRAIGYEYSSDALPRSPFKFQFIYSQRFVEFTISEPIENVCFDLMPYMSCDRPHFQQNQQTC